MGFDEQKVPKLREALADPHLQVTAVRDAVDVRVYEVDPKGFGRVEHRLEGFRAERVFEARAGWAGDVERTQT